MPGGKNKRKVGEGPEKEYNSIATGLQNVCENLAVLIKLAEANARDMKVVMASVSKKRRRNRGKSAINTVIQTVLFDTITTSDGQRKLINGDSDLNDKWVATATDAYKNEYKEDYAGDRKITELVSHHKCELKRMCLCLGKHALMLYNAFTIGHAVVQNNAGKGPLLSVDFQKKQSDALVIPDADIPALLIEELVRHIGEVEIPGFRGLKSQALEDMLMTFVILLQTDKKIRSRCELHSKFSGYKRRFPQHAVELLDQSPSTPFVEFDFSYIDDEN